MSEMQQALNQVFAAQQPDPAYIKAARELALREQTEGIAQRRVLRDWACLTCSCRVWFSRDPAPPQAHCNVHGTVMVTFEGEVI